MISCGKCGKRYDYEKYNGICPKCGRYNRRDSAVLESELHEKYDADPAHSAVSHERVHEKNYDSYRHKDGGMRKPNGNFWGAEENYTKKHLVAVIIVMLIIVMLFVSGTAIGYFGFSDESAGGIFDNEEETLVWEDGDETESLNSVLQRIRDSLIGFEDTEQELYYYEEEEDVYSDIVEEIWLSYSYKEQVDQNLTEEDWEGDHSVKLLDGDMEALEELEAEYSGQEGQFYLLTVHVYNDTSEDLDATSIVVEDITFADGEGNAWVLSSLKTFYSYWEVIEAGHNGYQDWLIFVPEDMLDAAQKEDYFAFSFTYETEQDGETVVNMYEDDVFYFD